MSRESPLPPELGHRPFTVAEARALGVSEQRLRHRGLSRPAYGVRDARTDLRGTDLARRAEATKLVLPAGSAFSHLTAARLLGLPLPRRWAPAELLDVMNVTNAAKIRRAGCSGHRGLESRRTVLRKGIRIVSPEDTWCDLGGSGAVDLDELIVLGDAVVHYQRGIPYAQLVEAVSRRRGGRGRKLLAEALPQLRPRNNSPMETRARLLFLRGGLPEPELNVVINDQSSGQWLSDSDFVWRAERVVAEFDGDHHRTDRQQWQNDVARRENLQDDGWAFMQLTYASVMVYPRNEGTVRRLRRLLGLLDP
ncbi:MAG: hypothetical protein ABIP19_03690 [Dermatophilaceae bacterium]